MALQLKSFCERCEQSIALDEKAYICVYECTFCQACTLWMGFICPNCEGELVRRPRPKAGDAAGESQGTDSDRFGVIRG